MIKELWADLWRHSDDSSRDATRGVLVVIIGRLAVKVIQFFRAVFLARLLFPEDFGLFALASLALLLSDVIFQSGFNNALIYEKEDPKSYLDTVWTANILRNALLSAVLFFAAPLFALFFDAPILVGLVRLISLSLLIGGFENVGIILFQKELRFGKKFLLDTSLVLADAIVVVVAGFIFHNVWALVIGSVGNRIAAVALSFMFHPYRPRFEFNTKKLRHLFSYGKWVWMMGILTLLITKSDTIVLGKLFDPTQLGFYQHATALALLPSLEIARVLGTVLFPFFAQIRDDRARLSRVCARVLGMMSACVLPASVGLFVLAVPAIDFVYGDRWLPSAPLLRILLLLGVAKSLEHLLNSALLASGAPRRSAEGLAIQGFFLAVLLLPLARLYGIAGVAMTVVTAQIAAETYLFLRAKKYVDFRLRDVARAVGIPLLASLGMYLSIAGLLSGGFFTGHAIFFAGALLGGMTYILLLYFLDRFLSGGELLTSLVSLRERIKR